MAKYTGLQFFVDTVYIVAKRCVLEQKLLLKAGYESHMMSYIRNRLVPK